MEKKILKSLILVFGAFLFFGSLLISKAEEVKFIFISDISLNKQNAYKLQDTVKEINSYKDIDFVVFGGNNIQKAEVNHLNYFTYLLKKCQIYS